MDFPKEDEVGKLWNSGKYIFSYIGMTYLLGIIKGQNFCKEGHPSTQLLRHFWQRQRLYELIKVSVSIQRGIRSSSHKLQFFCHYFVAVCGKLWSRRLYCNNKLQPYICGSTWARGRGWVVKPSCIIQKKHILDPSIRQNINEADWVLNSPIFFE